ncbi:MAG: hypothetical protein ACI4IK_01470 [Eubacterium sp.]
MDNMHIYNHLANTPKEAQKTITAGRLKGFTDINPMWRIQRLTEVFGACGFGWWYEVINQRIEDGANGEKKAFVTINLYVKQGNEVSNPIQGIGGSSFVSNEKSGPYTNDECFKMALTDAIGTACKSLGMSADIYFGNARSKYTLTKEAEPKEPEKPKTDYKSQNNVYIKTICDITGRDIKDVQQEALERAKSTDASKVCKALSVWLLELNNES